MWTINAPDAVEVVKSLLRAGADVNARDASGRTAVHCTLDLYSFKLCKHILLLLLESQADVNIHCTLNGNTPLHDAASIDLQTRQYDMTLRKVKMSFSTDSTNEIYAQRHAILTTPVPSYDETEGAEELREVIGILLKAGGSSTAKNFNGDTPLQCAIKSQNMIAALMLLRAAGNKADFIMDKLGDQEFLDSIEDMLNEMTG